MFDKDLGDYWVFDEHLKQLEGDEMKEVQQYVKGIKDRNGYWHKNGYSKIVVFHLTPGKRLIFPGRDFTHDSLVLPGNHTIAVLYYLDVFVESFVNKKVKGKRWAS